MLRFLIDRGAKVNLKRDGETALSFACEVGAVEGVRLLIGAKADLEDRVKGMTPLQIACDHGQLGVVRALVEAGARLDVVDGSKRTLFKIASDCNRNDQRELLDYLMDIPGAGTETADSNGNTPLHSAAVTDPESTRSLVSARADINAVNKKGETPLLFCLDFPPSRSRVDNVTPKEGCIRHLLAGGANLEAKDIRHGETPLIRAVRRGHLCGFWILARSQVDKTATDKNGKTAYDHATEKIGSYSQDPDHKSKYAKVAEAAKP
mmetsp:Transcript_26850/g.63854  ORF Transcript_26850/g.63854 Transcript_26850/m.63854 type:complete len:264 (+) Transcript_26850:74-865(+)